VLDAHAGQRTRPPSTGNASHVVLAGDSSGATLALAVLQRQADVEIWHADAAGAYSGFGSSPGRGTTNSKRYLRGHQKSDANGRLSFLTIYPGWYRGRTPHIHVKVHVAGNTVHTGQLFFHDATSDKVYATANYRSHGQPDTTNADDMIYRQAGGSAALVSLRRRSGTSLARGFNGSAVLAVKA
jgi:hypothetical protein